MDSFLREKEIYFTEPYVLDSFFFLYNLIQKQDIPLLISFIEKHKILKLDIGLPNMTNLMLSPSFNEKMLSNIEQILIYPVWFDMKLEENKRVIYNILSLKRTKVTLRGIVNSKFYKEMPPEIYGLDCAIDFPVSKLISFDSQFFVRWYNLTTITFAVMDEFYGHALKTNVFVFKNFKNYSDVS